ncbi:MAG: hypothetical protein ACQET7_08560, partial [Thermodesulfobacteriota bacterium]
PASFHPEMVFFANLGVNLRGCLCGVLQHQLPQSFEIYGKPRLSLLAHLLLKITASACCLVRITDGSNWTRRP